QSLAEAAATALGAQAAEFAKERGIAIYARATAPPPPGDSALTDGTIVREFASRPPGTVVGIASEKDLFLLLADDCSEELFEFLDDQNVGGKQPPLASTGDKCSIATVISRENLHGEDRFRSRLTEKFAA